MKNPRRKRTGYLSAKTQAAYNFDSRRRAAGYKTLERNKSMSSYYIALICLDVESKHREILDSQDFAKFLQKGYGKMVKRVVAFSLN